MQCPEGSLLSPDATISQHRQSSCTPPPGTRHREDLSSNLPQMHQTLGPTRITPQLEAIIQRAHEARDICAATGRVSHAEAQMNSKVWQAAHAQQTRAWADDAFSAFRNAAAKAKSPLAAQPPQGKQPVFNHEYTPLLEKYFEYNAYPSAIDRSVLAKKSMMTPRQIEVWFQNHRSRARKDGRPLRKLTENPLPVEISLKSLERKMPFFTIPEHERKSTAKRQSRKYVSSDAENLPSITPPWCHPTPAGFLSPVSPPHAFPALYPPRCDYDPFPTKGGAYKFPPPVWSRKPFNTQPTNAHRAAKIGIDMNDFIAEFETKLHLRVPTSKKRGSEPCESWCASRATRLPRAPLPALVRSSASQSSSPPFACAILEPSRPSSDTLGCRKVAHLPKRTPKSKSIAHRHGSPTISRTSPAASRSSSIASRSTSFGSEISTDRRPSSSSSSSSARSSSPTTPEQSHVLLLDDADSRSVSVSGAYLDTTDNPFRRSGQSPSPEAAMRYSFSVATQAKNPLTFGLEVPFARRLESRIRCFDPPHRSRAQPLAFMNHRPLPP
ncbi:putative homeodomain containing protein [Lyophyllum shimeji]|uniref:Homeodomain containing protein n=1 Tax=Lyophyllum shimeji TaxID=47721 RepID=A0A9P3PH96_LYOSH|nr:putative homeodomain containing protein [Lyophyllum shimeji]